ncbi:hypothetical protein JANAI62_31750 [Jannaschia pagri]|uniref:Phytase-like domain-containing protein n=1 Tax=Jannaschia pagri TaxID=2829797 RepID=A0ABQ4NR46_9RHOB|nr:MULTISPECIES: esterase-like activity of phytase family protein [unclassified Jannaschia]GIT92588.1 hypothetical protein JANAI61_30460 [Jannaschia sp. AI_61]GIT96552.1 hypothetical protein JANAI62_31750 [Jannaschia sp. AI_62]
MRRCLVCALALTLAAPAWAADHLGSYTWTPDWPEAGGFSALWLGPDGEQFATLSDRGYWVQGRLVRDATGAVTSVRQVTHGPLLRSTGGRLRGKEFDAEGLARTEAGWFVAFEGVHRVMRHDTLDSPPERIPLPPAFDGLQANSGLEALAASADGTLYAIPERSGAVERPFPVYCYDTGQWRQPFGLRRDGPFLVSGADIFDGRLYILERHFALVGFRSRVRSFDMTGGDERLEMESGLRDHDNLEGIAVWQDADGRRRMTLVSDNNQQVLQRTEFVDYVLD